MNSLDMTLQPFDTDLFGFSVYRANLEKYSDISALDESIPKDAGLVSIRVPQEWENAMRHTQFRKIENLIYLERSFERKEKMELPSSVRPASKYDVDACSNIAQNCFTHDRYHTDKFLDNKIADHSKYAWAQNNILGRSDVNFVIELEDQINTARTLTSLALSLRKKVQIKVRQPLQKMIIPFKNQAERSKIECVVSQLKGEINIKEVELLDDANAILVKDIRPNFKTLGPRFGGELKDVIQLISQLSPKQINEIEEKSRLEVKLNEKNIILESSDVEIFFKDIEGWQVAYGGGMTVALDIKLSPELKKEGIARELVNRVQNHRKDRGLEVTDKIDIFLKNEPKLEAAVLENKTYILSETLAKNLYFKPMIEEGYILEFEDIKTEIFIKKIFS